MHIYIRKDSLKRLYLYILMFFILFAPPLIKNVNIIIPITFFYILVLFLKYRKELFEFLNNSAIKKFLLLFVVYLGYFFIIVGINFILGNVVDISNYIVSLYQFFLVMLSFIISMYFVIYMKKNNMTIIDLLSFIVGAGLIQAVITLLMLLNSSIKEYFINLMYVNTGNEKLKGEWLTETRFYGFAQSLLDLFGLGTGIIASLPLFFYSYRKVVLCYIPLLILVPFMNSRTGLLIFVVALIIFMFSIILNRRKQIFGIVILISAFILVPVIFNFIREFSPDTVNWIIRDFSSFFENNGGTAETLFSADFWQIPTNLFSFIFGTGHTLYNASGFAHSDVGYINSLWRDGIVGMALVYGNFIIFLQRAKENTDPKLKIIFDFILLSMVVFMIKAQIMVYHPAMIIYFCLCIFSVTDKNEV